MTRERQRFAVRIDLAYLPTSHIVLCCLLKHLFALSLRFYRKSPSVSTHKIIPFWFKKKWYTNNLKCNEDKIYSTSSYLFEQFAPSGNFYSLEERYIPKNIIHRDQEESTCFNKLSREYNTNIIFTIVLTSHIWTKIENNFPEKTKISPKPAPTFINWHNLS